VLNCTQGKIEKRSRKRSVRGSRLLEQQKKQVRPISLHRDAPRIHACPAIVRGNVHEVRSLMSFLRMASWPYSSYRSTLEASVAAKTRAKTFICRPSTSTLARTAFCTNFHYNDARLTLISSAHLSRWPMAGDTVDWTNGRFRR